MTQQHAFIAPLCRLLVSRPAGGKETAALTPEQEADVLAHAYVPEQLPRYVEAITAARPHLFGDYLAYTAGDRLIFVGYPLREAVTSSSSCG